MSDTGLKVLTWVLKQPANLKLRRLRFDIPQRPQATDQLLFFYSLPLDRPTHVSLLSHITVVCLNVPFSR